MPASPATRPQIAALVRLSAAAPVAGGGQAGTAQKGKLDLPEKILIAPWGESTDLDGRAVRVNATTLSELAANQTRWGFDEVALDFSHNTVPALGEDGKPQPVREPQPIAAMGSLSVIEGEGVYFTPLSWTPEGETYYSGRHFRDLSPTVGRNDEDEVIFIHSVALTRNGQIRDLHAFSAAMPPLASLTTPTPNTMENTDYRKTLVKILKLDDAATDEELMAAAETAMTALSADAEPDAADGDAAPSATPMAAPTPDADTAPAATPPPAAAAAAESAPDVTALSARIDRIEKDNLIAEASRQGKVIGLSDEAIRTTPLSVLRELADKTPVTVPLSATVPPASEPAPAVTKLSAEEAVVAARLGYTAEQFRAANPA